MLRLVTTGWILVSLVSISPQVHAESALLQPDPAKSYILAITGRGGLLSFLGHEHAILSKKVTAQIRFNRETLAASTIEVNVPADSLVIDSDEARELAELKTGGPDADDAKKLQSNLESERFMDIAKFTQLRFETDEVEAKESGKLTVTGRLTLHGVTKKVKVPISYTESAEGAFRFTGVFKVQQSDYGIQPESVAGVVKVKDEVEIRIVLTTRPETAIAYNQH